MQISSRTIRAQTTGPWLRWALLPRQGVGAAQVSPDAPFGSWENGHQIPTGYRSPEKSSMSICKVYFSKNDDTQNDTPIFFTWNKKVDHPVAFHFCPKNRCGSLEKPSTAAMRSGDFDDPWPCGVAPSRRALAPWALRHGGIPSHRFQH